MEQIMSSHSEFGPGLTKDAHLPTPSAGRRICLKESQAEEKKRLAAQIEVMIADFDRIANDLDREIQAETDRAGIHDPAHYAYPTYTKAAGARRDNLKRSVQGLKVQLAKMPLGLPQPVN
jgi:CRP-like cAMP-binding protein